MTCHSSVEVRAQVDLCVHLCVCEGMHYFITCILHRAVLVCLYFLSCVGKIYCQAVRDLLGHRGRRAVLVWFGGVGDGKEGSLSRGKKTKTSLMEQVSGCFTSNSTSSINSPNKPFMLLFCFH